MRRRHAAIAALAVLLASNVTGSASAGGTAGRYERVSVNSQERQANSFSLDADISSDGRWVAFHSWATNLDPDVRGTHVYVRDRALGRTRGVSVNTRGRPANLGAWGPAISPNGRFVAFCSWSTNLARPDEFVFTGSSADDRYVDVFVRNLVTRVTRRASSSYRGRMANDESCGPSVSNDGDVAYISYASNLIRRDRNGESDVFVYDWDKDRVRRASVSSGGAGGTEYSRGAAISANGRYVQFYSAAPNLVANDTNWAEDVFLRDRSAGRTTRVNLGPNGSQSSGGCHAPAPGLSATGRFVLFACHAGDLVSPAVPYSSSNLYVRDRATGVNELVTATFDGTTADWGLLGADLSDNGRLVTFASSAVGFTPDDGDAQDDVFVRDLARNATTLLTPGETVDGAWPTISADGRYVTFWTDSPDLVSGDTNDEEDVFVTSTTR